MLKKKVTATQLREVFLDWIEKLPEAKNLPPSWRSEAAFGFLTVAGTDTWEFIGTRGTTPADVLLHSLAQRVYPRILPEYELVPG